MERESPRSKINCPTVTMILKSLSWCSGSGRLLRMLSVMMANHVLIRMHPETVRGFVYSLVAYYLIKDNQEDAIWSGAARIGRFQIKDGVQNPTIPLITMAILDTLKVMNLIRVLSYLRRRRQHPEGQDEPVGER